MADWIEKGVAANEIFKKYVEGFEKDTRNEIKFSVTVPDYVNEELLEVAERLGISRAQLSRDLIKLALEALRSV